MQELQNAARWLAEQGKTPEIAQSIFFGGGTPSLLPVPLLGQITDALWENFSVAQDAEVTLEANPETVNREFCRALQSFTPINRISLGAQSFRPENLAKLERLGSRESIENAASCLKEEGFRNFSLDLIFGIPGQSERDSLEDIELAAALEPQHLSFYNLTLKPAHTLYRSLPSADSAAELYEAGIHRLKELGYTRYEISNFSREDQQSRHNLLYWDGGDYLGVGPSAASRFFWDGTFHHRKQYSDLGKYLAAQGFPIPAFEKITHSQTVLEAAFLELRKVSGVDLATFESRYAYDLKQARKFPLFLKEGLLIHEDGKLKLTDRGLLLADSVTEELVDLG